MDEEKKELSVYDSEAQILELIQNTTDPEELAKLTAALEKVHNCISKEMSERWQLVGTIVAALIGATGVVGAQWVKGEMDSRYQDEGYQHEKTEAIIWNKNRHKR